MRSDKLLKFWDAAEFYTAGMLASLALFCAFYQVFMRYLFNRAPEWAEESVLYLIIWSVFIISSKLVRDDEHIGADFIFKRLPSKVQRVISICIALLALGFCVLVSIYGMQIVQLMYELDERSTTRLRFPMWIAYLSVPIGCGLVGLSYLRRLYLLFFKFDSESLFGCKLQEACEQSRELIEEETQ